MSCHDHTCDVDTPYIDTCTIHHVSTHLMYMLTLLMYMLTLLIIYTCPDTSRPQGMTLSRRTPHTSVRHHSLIAAWNAIGLSRDTMVLSITSSSIVVCYPRPVSNITYSSHQHAHVHAWNSVWVWGKNGIWVRREPNARVPCICVWNEWLHIVIGEVRSEYPLVQASSAYPYRYSHLQIQCRPSSLWPQPLPSREPSNTD